MTQEGETEGYTGADHVRAIRRHSAPGVIDFCLANSAEVPPELRRAYEAEDAEPIRVCREEIEAMGVRVIERPMLAAGTVARHNSLALAFELMEILNQA